MDQEQPRNRSGIGQEQPRNGPGAAQEQTRNRPGIGEKLVEQAPGDKRHKRAGEQLLLAKKRQKAVFAGFVHICETVFRPYSDRI